MNHRFLFWMLLLGAGCQALKQSPKYGFSEGYYKSRLFQKSPATVYVLPGEDSIKIYTEKALQNGGADTAGALTLAFPANEKPAAFTDVVFRQNTLDVDVLTIFMKYRPPAGAVPNQLITSVLNGAVYLGYRSDLYRLRYKQTPFRTQKRTVTHYGFSVGLFTGLGSAAVDEFVTNSNVALQYEGLVNPSGLAAILGVDKFSFGLLLGIDHLLDRNRRYWIYQRKPWVGLSVGLNLN